MSKNQPLNILVVDDSLSDWLLLRRAFSNVTNDIALTHYETGKAALDYLETTALKKPTKLPDLCLLDIKMPAMSGLDVLRKIKANSKLRQMSVFMLTSSDSPGDIKESFDHDCNGFFQKPHLRQDLDSMVQAMTVLWTGPSRFKI